MTAAVGVQLAEAAVAAHHRFQGGEGRNGALLDKEARVQHVPVGIVQRHHQVVHRQSRDPFMGGGGQMHQHADQRPAFAPAPVLAAGRFPLHHSGFL